MLHMIDVIIHKIALSKKDLRSKIKHEACMVGNGPYLHDLMSCKFRREIRNGRFEPERHVRVADHP